MGKALAAAVLDAGLAEIATATRLVLCSGEPANFAGIAAVALGSIALTAGDGNGDFVIAAGDLSGRKVTVGQQTGVNITASGTLTHIAIDDGTTLLHVTTHPSEALTSGGTATVAAWDVEFEFDLTTGGGASNNEPAGMTTLANADGSVAESGGDALGVSWLSAWTFDGGVLADHLGVVADPKTASGSAVRFVWDTNDSPESAAASGNFTGGPYDEVYVRMELSYEPGWNIGHKLFYMRTSVDSSTDFYVTREPNGSMVVFGQGGEGTIWISDVPAWGGTTGLRPLEDLDTQYVVELHVVYGTGGDVDEFHLWVDGTLLVSKTGSIGADGDWPAPFYGIEFFYDTEQSFTLDHHRLGTFYVSAK